MWYYFLIGLIFGTVVGIAIQDLQWQSFFTRLLASPHVTQIDIREDGSTPWYEVALHCGKKKPHVIRVVSPTVREGLVKHLYDDRSGL